MYNAHPKLSAKNIRKNTHYTRKNTVNSISFTSRQWANCLGEPRSRANEENLPEAGDRPPTEQHNTTMLSVGPWRSCRLIVYEPLKGLILGPNIVDIFSSSSVVILYLFLLPNAQFVR